MERRNFFKLTALASGGFILQAKAAEDAEGLSFNPNPFIEINSDGKVKLTAHVPEMGQGVKTTLPMILAEELEVKWEDVIVVTKPVNDKIYGKQGAGGSNSIKRNYDNLRKLGAAAKTMLLNAAAKKWGVPVDKCTASEGTIKHSDKVLTYQELVKDASKLAVPNLKSVKIKDSKDFKIIGKRIGGVDNESIVQGQPLFGIDQVQEGMKYASYVRCPSFNGKVKSADLDKVKKLSGVIDAFIVRKTKVPKDNVIEGVAIIAESTWQAQRAADALEVEWDTPNLAQHNSKRYSEIAKKTFASKEGKLAGIESSYHFPLLAHNTMEPQNCTAIYKNGSFELWAPTQNPVRGADAISKIFKVKASKVKVNLTRIGGGFGRRLDCDYMIEVAAIARKHEGVPIKLTWTKEQDVKHDYYRNSCWHHFNGDVTDSGEIKFLNTHVVSHGTNAKTPGKAGKMGANTFPLPAVKKPQVKHTVIPTDVPFGWWRAPISNGMAFVTQCFTDELAHKAGIDPLKFRQNLLHTDTKWKFNSKRMLDVLDAVAKKANWGKELPKGSGQGVAFYYSHSGYVAVIAEVTVSESGVLRVDKLSAAADVGPIMNLSGAENQVEGSMLDGLSSAWFQKIIIENGAVKNSNYHDYPVLRMNQSPKTEVVFIESDNPPTGLGEPALPPTIPAVCNAIFSATGKRVRELPIVDNDLSWT